jgi:hypothetical protein
MGTENREADRRDGQPSENERVLAYTLRHPSHQALMVVMERADLSLLT